MIFLVSVKVGMQLQGRLFDDYCRKFLINNHLDQKGLEHVM